MPGPPRLVMVVANGVDGDSRVQKSAWSAATAGWDVLVVGIASESSAVLGRIGEARVVLVPLSGRVKARADRRVAVGRRGAWLLAPLVFFERAARSVRRRMEHRASPEGGPVARALSALLRGFGAGTHMSWTSDLERLLTGVVAGAAPLIVHAHDYTALGVATRAVRRRRDLGHECHLVYDAHEHLPGIVGRTPHWTATMAALEDEGARAAGAVITVSGRMADLLVERFALARRPVVIENLPLTGGADAPDLRALAGVDGWVPLLVYSGALAERRGVLDAVRALTRLPDVHLVLVAQERAGFLSVVREVARREGVDARLHVVPFVSPEQVPSLLSGADIGLSPVHREPNHEVDVTTKYYEYAKARLPIVTSDVAEMARVTRAWGNGEVFRAGDVDDLARAVQRVLAAPQRYRAAYSDRFLRSLSWQAQAPRLLDVYAEVSGVRPRPAASAGPFEGFAVAPSRPEVRNPVVTA